MNKPSQLLKRLCLLSLVVSATYSIKSSQSSSSHPQITPEVNVSEVIVKRAKKRLIDHYFKVRLERDLDRKLLEACIGGTAEDVQNFLKKGANPNTECVNAEGIKTRVANFAALSGNLPALKVCVDHSGFSPTDQQFMVFALVMGHQNVLEYLLSNGVDPNAPVEIENKRCHPLWVLMEWHNFMFQMVKGRAVGQFDVHPKETGHFSCVDLLKAAGATMDPLSSEGETLLQVAVDKERISFVEKLLAAGADPARVHLKKNDFTRNSGLHDSALLKTPRQMRLYLTFQADTELKNNDGFTPLELLLYKSPKTEPTIQIDVFSSETLNCLYYLLKAGAHFTLPHRLENRIPQDQWKSLLKAANLEQRNILRNICLVSYILFLPSPEEVRLSGIEICHLIWFLKQIHKMFVENVLTDKECEKFNGLICEHLQRNFIVSHSYWRQHLIHLLLAQLRNGNPDCVHYFTDTEDILAEHLFEKVYSLYHGEEAFTMPTEFNETTFKAFATRHIKRGIRDRFTALKNRAEGKLGWFRYPWD